MGLGVLATRQPVKVVSAPALAIPLFLREDQAGARCATRGGSKIEEEPRLRVRVPPWRQHRDRRPHPAAAPVFARLPLPVSLSGGAQQRGLDTSVVAAGPAIAARAAAPS